MKKSPIIHVITGDGKGKTTASLGLALRAIGAEKRVKIIQFMKKCDFSEHKAIQKYKLPIEIECFGIGFYKILGDTHTEAEHKLSCSNALKAAKTAIESDNYDLIILDEINVAIGFKLIEADEVVIYLTNLNQKNETDIVLTGRRAHPKIKNIAHLVSDIKSVKHYFDKGQKARKGIEL
jgi:cob(I)alamin adenosyltransferase